MGKIVKYLKNIVTPGWCALVCGTGFCTYFICGMMCIYTNNISGQVSSAVLFIVYGILYFYFLNKWIKK